MGLSMSEIIEQAILADTQEEKERLETAERNMAQLQSVLEPIEAEINKMPELAKAGLKMWFETSVLDSSRGRSVSLLCAYEKDRGDLRMRQDDLVMPIDSEMHQGRLLMSWNRNVATGFARSLTIPGINETYKDISVEENLDAMKHRINRAVFDYLEQPGVYNLRYG